MKFFEGMNEITAEDIERYCTVVSRGKVKKQWSNNAPKDGNYEKYADCVIIADTSDPTYQGRRLLHRTEEVTNIEELGDPISSWEAYKETINLKYVPKRIKDADYPDSIAYLNAVMSFINEAKCKAKGKAAIKAHNNKIEADLNFMDVVGAADEITEAAGWKPTKGYSNYESMNTYYRQHSIPKVEYEKDRNHKMSFEIQPSRKGLGKLVITGLNAENISEILNVLFSNMK